MNHLMKPEPWVQAVIDFIQPLLPKEWRPTYYYDPHDQMYRLSWDWVIRSTGQMIPPTEDWSLANGDKHRYITWSLAPTVEITYFNGKNLTSNAKAELAALASRLKAAEPLQNQIVPSKHSIPTSPKDYARALQRLLRDKSKAEVAALINQTEEWIDQKLKEAE